MRVTNTSGFPPHFILFYFFLEIFEISEMNKVRFLPTVFPKPYFLKCFPYFRHNLKPVTGKREKGKEKKNGEHTPSLLTTLRARLSGIIFIGW